MRNDGGPPTSPEAVFVGMLTALTDAELAAMAAYQTRRQNTVLQILVCEELGRRGRMFDLKRAHLKALNRSEWARRAWYRGLRSGRL